MVSEPKGMDRDVILDQVERRACELEDKYHGCGQCGLLAIQETFDLRDELLFKAACGLSAGVGGTWSVCGALLGGILALGLKYGRDLSILEGSTEEAIAKERPAIELSGKLCKWFEREFGSLLCLEVRKHFLGVNLDWRSPWQYETSQKLGIHEYCCQVQARTARRAAALFMDPNYDLFNN